MRILIAAALGMQASNGMMPEAVAPIVNAEHASELWAFTESLKPLAKNQLKPWDVNFEDCFADNNNIALVDGVPFAVVDRKIGVSSEGGRRLALNKGDIRPNHMRGLAIQEHLARDYPNLANMVVPVHRAEFPGKPAQCSDRYAFEEIFGEPLNRSDEIMADIEVLEVAAKGLEVLRELHSVGLVHGMVDGSMVWIPGHVESIRLRNFGLAKVYFDSRRGQHVPVTNCKGGSRHVGVVCTSTVVDLTQFSIMLAQLSAGGATADLVAAFKEAVDRLGFTETFDYDFWIAAFRSAV